MRADRADFAYHLTKFFTVYLPAQRNLASSSIIAYRDVFRLLLKFFEEEKKLKPQNISLTQLNRENIEQFMRWLKQKRNNSPKTCNQRLGALNSFFTYLQYEQPDRALQCQQCMSIKAMKVPDPPLRHLTIDGIKALLEQPDISTKYGLRDLALLSLMYDTGARVSEVTDLCLSDVRFISPATIRLTGKGRKTRIVPLLSETEKLLSQYVKEFRLDLQGHETPLFQNRERKKMSRYGIGYILTKYADMARSAHPDLIPEKISPHVLRHSKAMHLLQASVNIVYIRDLLGHSDVKTTEIYARADNTLKREALEKASPIKHSPSSPSWNEDDGLMEWLRSLGR